jgi:hypothetical protein
MTSDTDRSVRTKALILEIKDICNPKFTAGEFVPTEFESAEKKAKFANDLCAFVSADFKTALFTEKFYNRLQLTFGHIAHNDKHGFRAEFFGSLAGKIEFLKQTLQWPAYGGPTYTYCDVEKALQKRLRAAGVLNAYRTAARAQNEAVERQLLKTLQEKYANGQPSQTVTILHSAPKGKNKPPEPIIQASLF